MSTHEASSWVKFSELVPCDETERRKFSEAQFATFARFQARYRAAHSMTVTFDGYKQEATGLGHAAILQVAMAYSALEMLERALKEFAAAGGAHDPTLARVPVTNPELADLFRTDGCRRLREALANHLDHERLKDRVAALSVRGDDVRPVAQGIRHLAFHGVFSPGTIAYRKRKTRNVCNFLEELRPAVLSATNDHFTLWVETVAVPELGR